MKNKKSRYLKGLVLIVLVVVSFIFISSFDHYQNYHTTIVKVTDVRLDNEEDVMDEHGNEDRSYRQLLSGKVMNGADIGKTVKLKNTYSYSQVYDFAYKKGNLLFVSLDDTQGHLTGKIKGIKRDKTIACVLVLFVLLLVFVGGKQGTFSVISLVMNVSILIFIVTKFVESKSINLLGYSVVATILFTVLSLLFVGGRSKKTGAAILSTLAGTFLSFLLGMVVLSLLNHKGLRYEEMEFVTRPPHDIFLSGLLIGCLGAVMDVAITIVSAIEELIAKKPDITDKELNESGMIIGKDIMGPMANVLLFAYISGALPVLILYLRNGMSFQYTFSMVLSLEFARALVGSIGIVLTVPIAVKLSIGLFRRKGRVSK